MHDMALRSGRLDFISLCSGGGGLDLGVELAIPDARAVCMVEREAFAVSQLVSAMEAGYLAPAPIWSDARSFRGRQWRGCVDGVIGGIPCQPHSEAGRRLGEDDERDLWSDARRVFVQSGAWFMLIENVRGMLFSGGAERVYGDLRRLGCQVEGGLFTAAEVGASHRRERIFILAVADAAFFRRDSGRGSGPTRQRGTEFVASNGCVAMAHAEGRNRNVPARSREDRDRKINFAGLGGVLADAERDGRGKGTQKLRARFEQSEPAVRGQDVVHARRSCEQRTVTFSDGDAPRQIAGRFESASGVEKPGRELGLFPPGPADLSRWGECLAGAPEFEPAFRRMADGLASRLDIARVDRLRLLGNGVVPLEAAYAVRTLATRLAARGSAGAAELVRMMAQ